MFINIWQGFLSGNPHSGAASKTRGRGSSFSGSPGEKKTLSFACFDCGAAANSGNYG